ncbi:hypothetical protein O1611_g728 [Lasiodiplodia mahajangana]|uniref:Uncharacterized protein n=1 Tax=Lasiodiplodia mahajangana TaxID=1108764 RepID=A0ACC2JZQ3_9PEZI|nr:hypothetical protein O1611_g728 [Lasiodiplodia mahajangana]
MASPKIEFRNVPADAIPEAEEVATWLRGGEADFQIVEGILKELPGDQTRPSESRIVAIHFEQPTIVPYEQGWMMEFIPVHTVKGPVQVGGQELSPNSYVHLTTEVRVTGDFYVILLMSKP